MNKKGLSILLALSMVFSLNTMAFAEEAVVEEEAVVAAVEDDVEVTQSQSQKSWSTSLVDAMNKTSFKDDGKTTISGTDLLLGSTGVEMYYEADEATPREIETTATRNIYGVAFYHGSKLKASDIGLYVQEKGTNYKVKVKKIKTSAKKDAYGEVTFTIKSIGSVKDLYDGPTSLLTQKEAKEAHKRILNAVKSAKNQTFTAYIAPSYVVDSISNDALKTLKKANKTAPIKAKDAPKTSQPLELEPEFEEPEAELEAELEFT